MENIINNINNIYNSHQPNKRELIEQYFIPTDDEKKTNGEVSTPVKLVDEMLNSLPPNFWKTKNKVFEPCCGKGNFVLGIFDFFYKGLEPLYPDEIERCKVIITECIYYADLTPLNVFITTELLKCHIQSYTGEDELDYEFNHYTGDTLLFNIKDKWNIPMEQFAIIGNPPYNTDPSYKGNKPLYNKFIEKYINGKFLIFVVPSRWFIGGKGLNKFRLFMLKRRDIVFIKHTDNSMEFFGKIVDIIGGVNYFLKDSSYNGDCLFNNVPYNLTKYECLIKPKYHKLVDFISNMESIITIYKGTFFNIETNDERLIKNGKIKCYVSSLKSKDLIKYIDDFKFNDDNTFWKVITTKITCNDYRGLGIKFKGKPYEIHSRSYISFRVNNEYEANSLISYLNTKFVNYILTIKKISIIMSKKTFEYIPLVPLDRIWTEEKVLEYLKIPPHLYI